MKLHFLVEGPSEVELLNGLLPRLIPAHKFAIYPHQGKGKLPADPSVPPDPKQRGVLDQLPAILRAWGKTFSPNTDRVVVLVDKDDDDCVWLLEKLTEMLEGIHPAPLCLFRIAIEEVESWYLGDFAAMTRAFNKIDKKPLADYKHDSTCGAWELFQLVIKDRLERKPYWARKMGAELDVTNPVANRSPSFQAFSRGVRRYAGELEIRTSPQKKQIEERSRRTEKRVKSKR